MRQPGQARSKIAAMPCPPPIRMVVSAASKTHVVYERRQLEDVNSAIREVETGQVKARLVFDLQ